MSNNLRDIFNNHSGRLIHKLSHYFDVYEKYFAKYIGTDVVILEIGISHGGSLQMWRKYFGPKARIYAIDINPECKKLEEDNIKIFIGSQEDPNFLTGVINQIPAVDILIDDGGHTMKQQIVSFETLYNKVKSNGIYLCEDTCTSYWYEYDGGLRRQGTFVEYSKKLIDKIYAWHYTNDEAKVDDFTRSTNAIHFYDSMVIFEKMPREKSLDLKQGTPTIAHNEDPQAHKRGIWHTIKKKFLSLGK